MAEIPYYSKNKALTDYFGFCAFFIAENVHFNMETEHTKTKIITFIFILLHFILYLSLTVVRRKVVKVLLLSSWA